MGAHVKVEDRQKAGYRFAVDGHRPSLIDNDKEKDNGNDKDKDKKMQ